MSICYKEVREMVQQDFDNKLNVTDDLKGLTVEQIQEHQRTLTFPYAVCAINVLGNINVSTMVRTAVLMGVEKFFIMGRKAWDKRGTVGAQNYIDLEVHSTMINELEVDSAKIYDIITSAGYNPIAVDTCDPSEIDNYNYRNIWYNPKDCLVFGNEGLGLPEHFITLCGHNKVTIPQRGVLRSLNVSVAAGIIMNEVCNQFMENLK